MEKRKVVLYNPYAVFYTMPLALLEIASCLDPQRYDVKIIDARLGSDNVGELVSEAAGAICVGITVLTGDPIRGALKASRAVKERYPGLPVVWGGWHPSLFHSEILDEISVDISVYGQGEVTFRELIRRLENGSSMEGLEGTCYRSGSKAVQNPPRPLTDMNLLPRKRYELLDVEHYFRLKKQRQLDYISSEGCFFRCAFCSDPLVYNRKWTALSSERVGEEAESLWKRYRFDELAFQDETFFTFKNRVEEIAEQFLKRGLKFKWTGTMRADQGYRMNEDTLKLLVRSGLSWVLIGAESGSNEMLKRLKKDTTVEQVLHCADMCKRHGIRANFPSIVGFPGESDDSVIQTLKLAAKLRRMSPLFETPVFYFKPYPGSMISNGAALNGFEIPRNLEEWSNFEFMGSAGPWVSPQKFKMVERFKFYNRFAGGPGNALRKPLQMISRMRLNNDFLSFPVEKVLVEKIKPLPRLY